MQMHGASMNFLSYLYKGETMIDESIFYITYLPASIRMLHTPEGLGKRIRRLVLSLLFLFPGSTAFEQT